MVFVHLYNDSSGSPRVLKSVIGCLEASEADSVLFLGSSGTGLLSNVKVPIEYYFYPRFKNKYMVLLAFIISQFVLFLKLCLSCSARQQSTIYINTVLPFGAAVFGWLFRKKVIYHIHEVSLHPPALFGALLWIANRVASIQIFVSQAQMDLVGKWAGPRVVLPNCVSDEIYRASISRNQQRTCKFTVLMSASLRPYKGIDVFVELARRTTGLPIIWRLLLNDSDEQVSTVRGRYKELGNLEVISRVDDPSSIYLNSDLIVNLSYVDQWIETFGLTIIEGFVFGKPAIAPPVGGPVEIISDGSNGYLIDSRNVDEVLQKVLEVMNNPGLYQVLQRGAFATGNDYLPAKFCSNIRKILSEI